MLMLNARARFLTVALHPEGVDRNLDIVGTFDEADGVALHPEGVDRNIKSRSLDALRIAVALHPEGVDRNPAKGAYAL